METLNRDGKLGSLKIAVEPTSKGRNEYETIIEDFLMMINADRAKAGMRKIGYMAIKLKLPQKTPKNPKGISNEDLHWFFKRCEEYARTGKGTFARCFYGSLKEKNP